MKIEANNIYQGDCYELIKQIPDKSIDCIYTDIPYLYVSGGGGSSLLSKRIENTKNVLRGEERRKRVLESINKTQKLINNASGEEKEYLKK